MNAAPSPVKVLIVGAGPSGLMMAAQLLRNGLQPYIIDSKEGPTEHSKALAVQARSLEIYRQLGIVDKALADGKPGAGVIFNSDGKKEAMLTLSNVGEGQTLYPYILMYPQNKNERLLLDYLTLNCCPVYWNTTLISLKQHTPDVDAILQNADGQYTLNADWVVGADGAHSIVRKQIQAVFKGDTYPNYFYLVDAKLDADFLKPDYINLYMGKKGFGALFPMPGESHYRILGNLPEEFEDRDNLTVDEVLPYLDEAVNSAIKIEENNWFTTYKLHHRMADKFREQRCFLIGDAAHIHSPVGGQGMNTGLQDAYNLAWKLAGVANERLKSSVLESYAAERVPVAKSLLNSTDAVFNLVMSHNWFINFIKRVFLFKMLNKAWEKPRLRNVFFKKISQIDISYRESAINLHLSKSKHIKAGDRLPYLKLYDEKQQTETDLHEWCNKPGFTLIILGKFDEMYLFTLAKWITQQYSGLLNFFYLPPSGKNLDVFEAFETDPHQQKAIIVRPDMYIGYLNDVVDIPMMDNYLQNIVGFSSLL